MSEFGIILNDVSTQVENAFRKGSGVSMYDTIAKAATGAITQAGDQLKQQGRANIAAAGMSSRWQNAWRVEIFPKKGTSIDSAAWGHHKIPYAAIFETGGTIKGTNGILWIPIGKQPRIGRARATPGGLSAAGVKLFTIKNPQHPDRPLLATSVRVSTRQANDSKLSLSLSKLRSGTAGKRGVIRAVPLFFGIPAVTLRARFNLSGVRDTVANRLGELYFAALRTT